jgi:CrcB protein
MDWMLLFGIAAAGSLGAVSRYLLSQFVVSLCGTFPLHTFVVNLVGCLLFGVVWALGHGRWPSTVTLTILVGFFGAFTTFSSFAFDCVLLSQDGRVGAMLLNVAGQNLLGILAMWAGIAIGTRLAAV